MIEQYTTPRVALAHLLVAHAQPLGAAGRKFSTTTWAPAHSSRPSSAAGGVGQVDRAATLAAIDRQVVGRLAARERRPPGARLVAALRALDLDHVGAEVGQHHRAVGAREHAREVHDPHALRAAVSSRDRSSGVEILTGARLAAAALVDSGVELAFGLPGVHNLALWRALGDSPIRLVGVRHEQAAAYAADGYARATGRLGVALTTTGPRRRQHARRRGRGVGLALADPGHRHRHPHQRPAARRLARRAARGHRPGGDVRAGGQAGVPRALGRRAGRHRGRGGGRGAGRARAAGVRGGAHRPAGGAGGAARRSEPAPRPRPPRSHEPWRARSSRSSARGGR